MEHSIASRIAAPAPILMQQGDPPSSAFLIILEGAASVTLRGPDGGASQEAAILATGNIVGEMSLMTGAPRNATVTALTRMRVLEIPKDAIEAILKKSPELAERFSRVLVARQRQNQDSSSARSAVWRPRPIFWPGCGHFFRALLARASSRIYFKGGPIWAHRYSLR